MVLLMLSCKLWRMTSVANAKAKASVRDEKLSQIDRRSTDL